jgi:CRP-like cAMP-binding protein
MQPERSDRNAILRYLSEADRDLLQPSLEPIELPVRFRLAEASRPFEAVYFLEAGIASITTSVRHEVPIEIGIVGREGIVNLPVLMGIDRSPSETFMQIHGAGFRMGIEKLREAMAQSPTLMPILLRFVHVYMVQTASTVLANGRAHIPERLARWLLMAGDRVDGDGVALTHEFLATMLGVRRPGVTIAIREFERRGFIGGARGVITILDRSALETEANGYYGIAEAEFERLFPA